MLSLWTAYPRKEEPAVDSVDLLYINPMIHRLRTGERLAGAGNLRGTFRAMEAFTPMNAINLNQMRKRSKDAGLRDRSLHGATTCLRDMTVTHTGWPPT